MLLARSRARGRRPPPARDPLAQVPSGATLAAIVLGAGVIRLYGLGSIPPGLFIDEIWSSYGPNIFLGTGNPLEWPIPVTVSQLVTGQILTYELGGDSAFWTRFSTAILGVGAVLLSYVLGNCWFGKRFGILTALIVAIAPWSIQLSRYSVPGMAFSTMFLLLIIFLERLLAKPSSTYILATTLSIVAALSTHAAARVFVPLFLVGYAFTRRSEVGSVLRHLLPQTILAVVIVVSYLVLQYVYVFHSDNPGSVIQASLTAYFAFSKGINGQAVLGVLTRYVQHWSPQFLVTSGDPNIKYSTGIGGELGLFGPLAYVGAVWTWHHRAHPVARTLLWWGVLWPLPSALLTPDNPNAVRGASGMPLLAILTCGGMWLIKERFSDRQVGGETWTTALVTLLGLQAVLSLVGYFYIWPRTPGLPAAFDYGYREAAQVLLDLPPRPLIVSDRWRAADLLSFYGYQHPAVRSVSRDASLTPRLFTGFPSYLLTSAHSDLIFLRSTGRRVRLISEIRTSTGEPRFWLAEVQGRKPSTKSNPSYKPVDTLAVAEVNGASGPHLH
jgi:hypothetical protein